MKNGWLWVLGIAAVVGVVILRKKILSTQDEFLTQITGRTAAQRHAEVDRQMALSKAGLDYGTRMRMAEVQYNAMVSGGVLAGNALIATQTAYPDWPGPDAPKTWEKR